MKYSVIILTGLLTFGFFGCSMHKAQRDKNNSLLVKQKAKKSSSKVKKPQSKEKKIINDYKTTIYKNVAKSKDKKKQLAILETKKEKLLNEMKLLQESYPKSKNKAVLNKKREQITKELNRINKEYEMLESKVVVVNYSQQTTKNKD